ncbi:MAG: serine/threonine protein phosphatase [Sphingomonas sp.]|nr:serine/threonine protein phosphatase [Sphingomonas sp.]
MFNFSPKREQGPAGARGYRAYAVGDIHGRVDLLEHLLAKIHADLQRRPARKTLLVFVGDLIDRGPSSAQVIERLRCYHRDGVKPVFLLGNHEEVMLRALAGDSTVVESWLQFGGLQCLQSYGVTLAKLRGRSAEEVIEIVRAVVPREHVEFLETFADSCRFGDYLFVHAGIRPGIEVDQQSQSDLRWIREPFLFDERDHGFLVVHGHTITDEVEERPNRIGIDTGAYRSGLLTALAIEGTERWLIDTRAGVRARD